MLYRNVYVESLGYTIPDEIVTSDQLEDQLKPVYSRLRLPSGRLELMTGIAERRFWKPGTLPSDMSIRSGEAAIQAADFDRDAIGLMIHGSVCRDHLEPATASRVHHGLYLPFQCTIYDVSNACLGLLNGVLQAANQIELGFVEAALVVGSEGSRQLVENTVATLNRESDWTRKTIKSAVASLTIGSASCAILLTNKERSTTQNRLLGGATGARTVHHELCHSGRDEAVADGMQPFMLTDSEALLNEGVETGRLTFKTFNERLDVSRENWDRTFCHQVGTAHQKRMLETLELSPERDFSTYEWLGNTGSAALPVTMARGIEEGFAQPGHRLALLGIGSGINCVMLGLEWNSTKVLGRGESQEKIVEPHLTRAPSSG